MERIKRNIPIWIAGLSVVLSGLNVLIGRSEYSYRPKSYLLFTVAYCIVIGAVTLLAVLWRNKAGKASRIFGMLMPIFALLYSWTLGPCVDWQLDGTSLNLLYAMFLLVLPIVASLVIFFASARCLWVQITTAVLTGIVTIVFGPILLLTLLFLDIGANTVVQRVDSPQQTYTALVVSSDQGALGGATHVRVRNVKNVIPLVSGSLETETKTVWTGSWQETATLLWSTEDTLLINGTPYPIE